MDHFDDPADPSNENWHLPYPSIAEEIRAVRGRLRFTQRQFAGYFGFPLATLRHWEYGDRRPTGCAYVLLQLIRENPRLVLQVVRKARARNPGDVAPIKPAKSYRAPPGMRRPV